jgi:hypothetical protein
MPAVVPFTVTIPRVIALDDPDPDFIEEDLGDYYAVVTIGNYPEQESSEVEGIVISPNWTFTQMVDTSASPVRVRIELYDYDRDELFRFEDDQMDINPNGSDRGITIFVDLATGTWVGDVPSPAASATGNNGPRAQLFFDIDSDGDGLNNRWELVGLDGDNNGTIDLTLPGANPGRKDLFVEVDAMSGRAPVPLPPIINVQATTPITVTSNFHGLSTGTRVTLVGIRGTGAIGALNGRTFTVTRQSNNTFTLDGTTGGGAYIGGGSWSLANLAGTGLATGTSIDLAIDAFLRAPVQNHDGTSGIWLHVQMDELALPLVPWNNDADGDGLSPFGEDVNANGALDPGEDTNGNGTLDNGDADDQGGSLMYTRLRNSNFGTPAERGNPATMTAKALAYRYGPFVDIKVDAIGNNQGVTTSSSGIAYSASSFMVSMGAWSTPGGRNDQQAGTFMHELGHTLGLGHGGGDRINNKPNYYSLMNYTWQTPDAGDVRMQASWRMDFSIGNYPALDESNLNEPAGLGGIAGRFVRVGPNIPPPAGSPPGTGPTTRVVAQTGPIDWDNDGSATGASVAADANYDGISGQILNDYNDWANLKYGIASAQAGFSKPDDLHFTFEQWLTLSESFVYDIPSGNGADAFTLRRAGDLIELVNDANGVVVLRRPYASTTYVIITGANFENDQLTIDFNGGNPIPPGGVQFDGGASAVDTLEFRGTPPAPPSYAPAANAGPEAGRIDLGASFVNFTGLEFVRPVAPRITDYSFGPTLILENGVVTISGSFVDPGSLSTHRLFITWGDGVVEGPIPLAPGARSFNVSHRYRDDNPTGTPSDLYTATLSLVDNDSLSATRSTVVRVNNVAPQILNAALTPEIDENGTVTLSGTIVDPGTLDTFVLVVDWGEGAPQTYSYGAGATSFAVTHQYLDDDPTGTPSDSYTVRFTLMDDDTGMTQGQLATLVRNVAPVVTAFTSDAVECGDKVEGDTVHVVGSFTDVGTLDTHSATIDWGDGTITTAAVVQGSGSGNFTGSHAYASGGIFRIVVTLTDDDTGQTTSRTYALITGVGILDGQLQAVGTKGDDAIVINRQGNNAFKVHASFIKDSPRTLPAGGVTSIAMILCEGDDTATIAGNIDLPTFISAEEGDDRLNGGAGPSILLGGAGNDMIVGGSAHDILVGGFGADRIIGNGGDDILISGDLVGAADPIDLLDELFATLDEWVRFRDRSLTGSRLIPVNDDDADSLTGSAGDDWFFFDFVRDTTTDKKKKEAALQIG